MQREQAGMRLVMSAKKPPRCMTLSEGLFNRPRESTRAGCWDRPCFAETGRHSNTSVRWKTRQPSGRPAPALLRSAKHNPALLGWNHQIL